MSGIVNKTFANINWTSQNQTLVGSLSYLRTTVTIISSEVEAFIKAGVFLQVHGLMNFQDKSDPPKKDNFANKKINIDNMLDIKTENCEYEHDTEIHHDPFYENLCRSPVDEFIDVCGDEDIPEYTVTDSDIIDDSVTEITSPAVGTISPVSNINQTEGNKIDVPSSTCEAINLFCNDEISNSFSSNEVIDKSYSSDEDMIGCLSNNSESELKTSVSSINYIAHIQNKDNMSKNTDCDFSYNEKDMNVDILHGKNSPELALNIDNSGANNKSKCKNIMPQLENEPMHSHDKAMENNICQDDNDLFMGIDNKTDKRDVPSDNDHLHSENVAFSIESDKMTDDSIIVASENSAISKESSAKSDKKTDNIIVTSENDFLDNIDKNTENSINFPSENKETSKESSTKSDKKTDNIMVTSENDFLDNIEKNADNNINVPSENKETSKESSDNIDYWLMNIANEIRSNIEIQSTDEKTYSQMNILTKNCDNSSMDKENDIENNVQALFSYEVKDFRSNPLKDDEHVNKEVESVNIEDEEIVNREDEEIDNMEEESVYIEEQIDNIEDSFNIKKVKRVKRKVKNINREEVNSVNIEEGYVHKSFHTITKKKRGRKRKFDTTDNGNMKKMKIKFSEKCVCCNVVFYSDYTLQKHYMKNIGRKKNLSLTPKSNLDIDVIELVDPLALHDEIDIISEIKKNKIKNFQNYATTSKSECNITTKRKTSKNCQKYPKVLLDKSEVNNVIEKTSCAKHISINTNDILMNEQGCGNASIDELKIKKDKQCRMCLKTFYSDVYREEHSVTECNILECPFCLTTYLLRDKDKFLNHLKIHYREKKPYRCPICLFSCARKIDINTHISAHPGPLKYCCPLCKCNCKSLDTLFVHFANLHPTSKIFD